MGKNERDNRNNRVEPISLAELDELLGAEENGNLLPAASFEVRQIASRLEKRGVPMAENLTTLAEMMDMGQFDAAAGQNFNPSMEMPTDRSINDLIAGPGNASQIKSFVSQAEEVEPDIDTHVCSITFKAGKTVSRSDMMNYILNIDKELEVVVEKFQWSKTEAKKN
jgi:hypothetical protein